MDAENSNVSKLGLSVTDHVSAMLAYWDKDLVCQFANAAYHSWFGKNREEMVGKMTIKELLGPLYEKNLPYILGALEGKDQTFERDIPIPSGGLRSSIANYFPDIVDGEVKGFFVHVADITPIKQLEKKLVESIKIIGEQNKLLMNFANSISHNLKNYAHGFSGVLELLDGTESSEMRTELINLLKTISNNFTRTINNLNEISQVQNLNDIQLIEIDLHEYIIKIISTLSIQINISKAIIKNNVNPFTWILGNPAYMESILLNFLTNAIKYKHPNRDPVIELDCTILDNEALLTITDNGRGINMEKYRQDLFGIYKTFHGNEDARGIGLYITKYQIEAIGGYVDVISEVNKGTKFSIHFKCK